MRQAGQQIFQRLPLVVGADLASLELYSQRVGRKRSNAFPIGIEVADAEAAILRFIPEPCDVVG